jgi:hypothetical protein
MTKSMNNSSLIDIYNEIKKRPTPAADFIKELCEATNRCEMTVRAWVTGRIVPERNIQLLIAMHMQIDVDVLFPSKDSNHDYC